MGIQGEFSTIQGEFSTRRKFDRITQLIFPPIDAKKFSNLVLPVVSLIRLTIALPEAEVEEVTSGQRSRLIMKTKSKSV